EEAKQRPLYLVDAWHAPAGVSSGAQLADEAPMRTVRQLLAEKPAEVFAVSPDAPVIDAVRLMAEKSIGAVLVMRGDELAGILSERDYARKIVLQGRSSADTPVRAIMTADVVTVGPDTTVNACMQLVTHRRIRHLP